MAQIKKACWECQQIIEVTGSPPSAVEIGQIADRERLRYSLSYNCFYCGAIAELDDVGFPPENIRQAIIEEQGKYFLKIDNYNISNKTISIKILRQALELSIPEVLNLSNSYPHVAKGKKVEMKWLQNLLLEQEISSKIELIADK